MEGIVRPNFSKRVDTRRAWLAGLSALALCACLLLVIFSNHESRRNVLASVVGEDVQSGSGWEGDQGSDSSPAETSSLALFNPSFDLDSPRGEARESSPHGSLKLQQGLQLALLGAKTGHTRSSDDDDSDAMTSSLFDPSHDPDSPQHTAMYSSTEAKASNAMKSKLRLQAKVAMLASRQSLDMHDIDALHDDKKKADSTGPAKPPSMKQIAEEVQQALDNGESPEKIIEKEKEEEDKYEKSMGKLAVGSKDADVAALP